MKHLNYILLFSLVFGLSACFKNNNSLIGEYQSTYPNTIIRFFNQDKSWAVGSELILKSDSSFRYLTWANELTGRWTCNEDSLFLWVKTSKWRKESERTFGKEPEFDATKPYIFEIKDDALEQQFMRTDNSGTRVLIELLVKENK